MAFRWRARALTWKPKAGISFSPSLNFEAVVQSWALQRLTCVCSGTLGVDFDITLSAAESAAMTDEISIFDALFMQKPKHIEVIPIGCFPVVLVTELDFLFGVQYSGEVARFGFERFRRFNHGDVWRRIC